MHASLTNFGNAALTYGSNQSQSVPVKRASPAVLFLILGLAVVFANSEGCGGGETSSAAPAPPSLPAAASLPASCTSATAGSTYSCQISVSSGKAPFTWTVTGLPTGLSFAVSADTTSITISGTPQAQAAAVLLHTSARPGATPDASTTTANVQVTATDANGNSSSLSFAITVISAASLAITTSSLPGGTAGSPYSTLVTATGGTSPYTWTITGLPSGLSASSSTPSATISGTTEAVGTVTVTTKVTDAASNTASATLSLTIAQAAALTISSASSLPNGTAGIQYSQTLAATGGVSPYSWTLASGSSLPTGFTLSSGGVVSGSATSATTFSFTAQVSDAEVPAQTNTKMFSIIIIAATNGLSITTTSPLAAATLNSSYTETVTASGGTPPYTWTLASGSTLPGTLALTSGSPSATISGTPGETGTFQFTLNVTDSASNSASATFLITISGSTTLNCPTTVNLTLCGTYVYGMRGFNGSGGAVAFGGVFVANSSGDIISGGQQTNDSVAGPTTSTFTGGSYVMDSSGDGRGALTLTKSDAGVTVFRFVLESSANCCQGSIEEFDSTGVHASGTVFGPGTPPFEQFPANLILGLAMEGVDSAGNRTGFIGDLQVGASGCDGASGSLNSPAGEFIFTNTAGTVNKSLTATGSCTAADTSTGVGTAQITVSGGTPFTSNTLNFVYIAVGGTAGLFLETDAIGKDQPILAGLGTGVAPPSGGFNATSLGCPCLLVSQGTSNGNVSAGRTVASITRMVTTPGAGATGTLSGVLDENAAGTITLAGAWPYSAYSVDSDGVGTITGTGSSTIHFIITGSGGVGDTAYTVDESAGVDFGSFRTQNGTTIGSAGSQYVLGRDLGVLGIANSTTHILGVVTPSGATSGTLTGTLDLSSASGNTAGATASGMYNTLDSTGRGTGTANLTDGSTSVAIVIYARRAAQFVILDVQSANPNIAGAKVQ